MKLIVYYLFASLLACSCSKRVTYEGYKLLSIESRTKEHADVLVKLETHQKLILMSEPRVASKDAEIVVSPENYHIVTSALDKQNIKFHIKDNNMGSLIGKEFERLDKRFRNRKPGQLDFDIDDWNRLEDIETQLDTWATQCPGNYRCEVKSLGTTYNGNAIKTFRIYDSSNPSGRRAHWIDGGIHAREWISISTTLGIMKKLIEDYNTNSEAKRLVDTYDWFFLPVNNPDGYVYTWDNERLWRKNRVPYQGCFGVDLNRNFNVGAWGTDGVSHDPCSDLYCGPSAASEIEVSSVQDELNSIANRSGQHYVTTLTTLHSSGYMWMFPPGNTEDNAGFVCDRRSDHDEQMRVANIVADAVGDTNGDYWRRGTSCEVIYATSGATDDYARFISKIPYAFNPELRGPGFTPGREDISPSTEEVWNGIVAQVDATAGRPRR